MSAQGRGGVLGAQHTSLLVGSGDAGLRAQLAVKFPTGALVALSFDGPWADLDAGTARIDALFVPRSPSP